MGESIIKKYFPAEEWESNFFVLTGEIKAISDYSKLNMVEVMNLPYTYFMLLKKDSWLSSLKRSEAGIEFLKTIQRLKTTEAELGKVRNKINKD